MLPVRLALVLIPPRQAAIRNVRTLTLYVHYGKGLVEEKTERFEMRVPASFLKTVDDWRRKQADLPSRAEAIRRLVEMGLEARRDR